MDIPLRGIGGVWTCDHCDDDYFDAERQFNEWFESHYAQEDAKPDGEKT